MDQLMALVITRADAELDAHLLRLDDDQRAIALALHKDYLRRYRESADVAREAYRVFDFGDGSQTDEARAEAGRAARRARDAHRRLAMELHAHYLGDLSVLAVDCPPGAMERVERARERGMARALVLPHSATEIIDPITLARQLAEPIDIVERADDPQTTAGVLMEFERAAAPVCARINALAIEVDRAWSAALEKGEQPLAEDFARSKQTIARLVEEVRALSDRYVERVAVLLPDAQRDEWTLAYNRRCWPEAYAPGPVEATLRSLRGMPGLDAEQHEQIEAIRQQYRRAVDPVNARYARHQGRLGQAIRADREPDRDRSIEARRERRAAIDGAIAEIQDAKADRQQIFERYTKRLRDVLTPEQIEALDAQ
ncbi:MAG: Spy/CpxP family protein refolding chaperone [Phycisphaerales bacterium JB064]